MTTQKEHKERRARIAELRRRSRLCEIISPSAIIDLRKYCAEEEQTISLCYGYNVTYIDCPKTCKYAKEMGASKDEGKKYER